MKYFLIFYFLGVLWLTYFEIKSRQPKQQTPPTTIQPAPTEAGAGAEAEDETKYI